MERYESASSRHARVARRITQGFLAVFCLGLPLIYHNYYYDITETKQLFFLIAALGYALILLLLRIALPPPSALSNKRRRINPAVLALAGFFVCLFIASWMSAYPEDVLLGETSRYQGLLTAFAYFALVSALTSRAPDARFAEWAVCIAAGVVSLLGVLNHFGVDPLGFMTDLRAEDRGRFLSTIGNANFYSGWLSLAFPVALGAFIRAKRCAFRRLAAGALALASLGTLVSGSDSAALWLAVTALVFPLLLFSDRHAFSRLFLGGAVFFFAATLFGALRGMLPQATYLSALIALLVHPAVSLSLLAASLLLFFAVRRGSDAGIAKLKRPYRIALGILILLAVAAVIFANTALADFPLGGAEKYLRFSDSWGTGRGKIWAFCIRFFGSLPAAQKLFGAGPGALYRADAVQRVFTDASLDTAHNEYLQYLITSGALGLACYLAALSYAAAAGIRKSAHSPVFRGFVVALIACAVQAAVNIAQPMSTPLLFVFLGLLAAPPDQPPEAQP